MKEKLSFDHPEIVGLVQYCLEYAPFILDKKRINEKLSSNCITYSSKLKRVIRIISKSYVNVRFIRELIRDIINYCNEYMVDNKTVQKIMIMETSVMIKLIRERRKKIL